MINLLDNQRKIKAIVSVDENWGIGKAGKLLSDLPGDMKFFKETTMGHVVVMGRKTLESLPNAKPLPGRLNIIITRDQRYAEEAVVRGDLLTATSVMNAIELVKSFPVDKGDLYVIGGGEIYLQFLPFYDSCLVTKMKKIFYADTFFPNLDEDKTFKLTKESELFTENDTSYVFTEYERMHKLD